jgi:hypothetical protein
MYANVKASFIEKEKAKAHQNAVGELGDEEGKDSLLWQELEDSVDDMSIEDNGDIYFSWTNSLGSFGMTFKPSTDDFIKLLEIAVKKANKIKTLLEASK